LVKIKEKKREKTPFIKINIEESPPSAQDKE